VGAGLASVASAQAPRVVIASAACPSPHASVDAEDTETHRAGRIRPVPETIEIAFGWRPPANAEYP
jgi:hypothetical protein